MTVWVDNARRRLGRMRMCHMWADTPAELHRMAMALGVRNHVQRPPKASWLHYDVCLKNRDRAIKLGARLTDRYEALAHRARQTDDFKLLDRITRMRARKGLI